MSHILNMFVLGLIAGMISIFWTRLIRRNMIFSFIHVFLTRIDNKHIVDTGYGNDAPLSTFLRCIFCLTPWIVFLLELFYILEFHPWWLYATIGTFAGLGAGNIICELVHSIRNGE
jgi:hypothetical protein